MSAAPAIISNFKNQIVFNKTKKTNVVEMQQEDFPAAVVFMTENPVLFSPLTAGVFEQVSSEQIDI